MERNEKLDVDLTNFEREKNMPYVTPFERYQIDKGRREGIESALDIRFGAEGLSLVEQVREISNLDQLHNLL